MQTRIHLSIFFFVPSIESEKWLDQQKIPHLGDNPNHSRERESPSTWFYPKRDTCSNLLVKCLFSKKAQFWGIFSLGFLIILLNYFNHFRKYIFQIMILREFCPLLDFYKSHFLMLSIDIQKMPLEAREYNRMQLKKVYPACEQNDIKIVELFEQ